MPPPVALEPAPLPAAYEDDFFSGHVARAAQGAQAADDASGERALYISIVAQEANDQIEVAHARAGASQAPALRAWAGRIGATYFMAPPNAQAGAISQLAAACSESSSRPSFSAGAVCLEAGRAAAATADPRAFELWTTAARVFDSVGERRWAALTRLQRVELQLARGVTGGLAADRLRELDAEAAAIGSNLMLARVRLMQAHLAQAALNPAEAQRLALAAEAMYAEMPRHDRAAEACQVAFSAGVQDPLQRAAQPGEPQDFGRCVGHIQKIASEKRRISMTISFAEGLVMATEFAGPIMACVDSTASPDRLRVQHHPYPVADAAESMLPLLRALPKGSPPGLDARISAALGRYDEAAISLRRWLNDPGADSLQLRDRTMVLASVAAHTEDPTLFRTALEQLLTHGERECAEGSGEMYLTAIALLLRRQRVSTDGWPRISATELGDREADIRQALGLAGTVRKCTGKYNLEPLFIELKLHFALAEEDEVMRSVRSYVSGWDKSNESDQSGWLPTPIALLESLAGRVSRSSADEIATLLETRRQRLKNGRF